MKLLSEETYLFAIDATGQDSLSPEQKSSLVSFLRLVKKKTEAFIILASHDSKKWPTQDDDAYSLNELTFAPATQLAADLLGSHRISLATINRDARAAGYFENLIYILQAHPRAMNSILPYLAQYDIAELFRLCIDNNGNLEFEDGLVQFGCDASSLLTNPLRLISLVYLQGEFKVDLFKEMTTAISKVGAIRATCTNGPP